MLEIISCSRRTDIPAFYYEWLQECLEKKSVTVKNPYNQADYFVDLSPEKVHSICLWSKSFANVLENPAYLTNYHLYFQFTITGFSKLLETNVVDTREAIHQMEELAERYSPRQINWRFDPIILSGEGEKSTTNDDLIRVRLKVFEELCNDISSFGVQRCTISFLYLYKKVAQRLKTAKINYFIPSEHQQIEIVNQMVEIADKYKVTIYTCSSPIIERVSGVKKSRCIDGDYLEQLFGKRASQAKDGGQRAECGCTRSRDIGSYRTQSCRHGCRYCYAM